MFYLTHSAHLWLCGVEHTVKNHSDERNLAVTTSWTILSEGARCSSVVEHLLMVRLVVGSITHGGSIELLLIP